VPHLPFPHAPSTVRTTLSPVLLSIASPGKNPSDGSKQCVKHKDNPKTTTERLTETLPQASGHPQPVGLLLARCAHKPGPILPHQPHKVSLARVLLEPGHQPPDGNVVNLCRLLLRGPARHVGVSLRFGTRKQSGEQGEGLTNLCGYHPRCEQDLDCEGVFCARERGRHQLLGAGEREADRLTGAEVGKVGHELGQGVNLGRRQDRATTTGQG